MRTTRNIEQVFSKIKSIISDVKYDLIKNNFRELPDFQNLYENYYKENKYINPKWIIFEEFDNFFIKDETIASDTNFNIKSLFIDRFSVVRFLKSYIFDIFDFY
ncbi:hypothetical protein [Mycoplasma phage sp.]|nr:hypothetical protein [Mycoplasma phage sp.]